MLRGFLRALDPSGTPSSPPPGASSLRALRPWYLVAAMALTWFIGVRGVASGFSGISFLRAGSVPDVAAVRTEAGEDPNQVVMAVIIATHQRAMAEAKEVTFPLSAAKLLLSGLLVVASGFAMAGRPGARKLALQALAANAVLAVLDYSLTRGIRSAWIEAAATTSATLPGFLPEHRVLWASRAFWWWSARLVFVIFELGSLAVAAFALLRERTRVYFQAVAEATESAEEP